MSESVYKVIEVIGTSKESWEQAATLAMMTASKSLRDIRVGEVVSMDVHLDGQERIYRTKIKVSFKYHDDE
jgi:dodecin